MKKYKKRSNRKIKNPYILFFVFIIATLAMGVGYSEYFDKMTIEGTANAKYAVYEIQYELNGGTNPENIVQSFKVTDDIPLPIPNKMNYKFCGWYDNEEYIGERINSTKEIDRNITLYAKWEIKKEKEEGFYYEGEYEFTGDNYINTNVYLYSKENIKRNFLMSFDVINVSDKNVNHSALMNSMNESGSPWPGHVVKVSGTGTAKSLKFESNSNTSSTGDVYISSDVKNIRILRMDEKLYYSFDGADFIRINNYKDTTQFFDVPVTFGCSMDGTKQPYRFFTGTLANMYVSFVDDKAIIDGYFSDEKVLKVAYEHKGQYEFDGKSIYIDTGLCLFSKENFEKDFEISFNIDYVGKQEGSQNTIINTKNETISSYPAFVYRLYQSKDNTIKFESKGGTGSGATNKIDEVQNVRIMRKDSKMYLSINNKEEKLVYDFTKFKDYFSIPLTIGASLDANGQPFRFFNGTLSDIVIKVEERK